MIIKYKDKNPKVSDEACVMDSAEVIGDVTIGKDSSIWFGSVVRGDINKISIGEGSNVQDNATLHVDKNYPCLIGDNVSIGHNAVVHGSEIGDGTLIGMGSIVLDGAKIGRNCIIAAGAVVTQGAEIPDRSLVVGVPGKVIKELSEEQIENNLKNADNYINLWKHGYKL